jgi:hypothetical protein
LQFWAIAETTPLFDRGSEPIGFVKILLDRTNYKAMEDALREETRALEISAAWSDRNGQRRIRHQRAAHLSFRNLR